MLRIGNKGVRVSELQKSLNKIGYTIVIDGVFGTVTKFAVIDFQSKNGLIPDGIVGKKTRTKINAAVLAASMPFDTGFIAFIDAGHGKNTDGKRAYHEGAQLHNGGWYYEWCENMLVAEMTIKELTARGVSCVRTKSSLTADTGLTKRANNVKSWLDHGYCGYLHSFHSNAISSKSSPERLENTRGVTIFNTKKDNLSDKIATFYHETATKILGAEHTQRQQDSQDGDPDYEANFTILAQTNLDKYPNFAANLEEFDFHTSRAGCEFIISHRKERVQIAVDTILHARNLIQAQMK